MTRQEREKVVLDLYHNQGKNIREIAQEARMSFRDIGTILNKADERRTDYLFRAAVTQFGLGAKKPAIPPKPIVLTNGIILLSMPLIFLFTPTFFGCCYRFVVVVVVYVFTTIITTKVSFNRPPNIPAPRNIATLMVDFLYYCFRQSDSEFYSHIHRSSNNSTTRHTSRMYYIHTEKVFDSRFRFSILSILFTNI
jgi:hypothetical protein